MMNCNHSSTLVLGRKQGQVAATTPLPYTNSWCPYWNAYQIFPDFFKSQNFRFYVESLNFLKTLPTPKKTWVGCIHHSHLVLCIVGTMAVFHFQESPGCRVPTQARDQTQFGGKMFNLATFLVGRNFLILLAKIMLTKANIKSVHRFDLSVTGTLALELTRLFYSP